MSQPIPAKSKQPKPNPRCSELERYKSLIATLELGNGPSNPDPAKLSIRPIQPNVAQSMSRNQETKPALKSQLGENRNQISHR
jgi:hypothetical protein